MDYEHFYLTNTLRGNAKFKLKIQTMSSSQHSGVGSGYVPDVFRIFRSLLSNLEDPLTGKCHEDLYGKMPPRLYEEADVAINLLGKAVFEPFKLREGMEFTTNSPLEAYMNNAFRPQLTLIGIDNIPSTATGGNVLRSEMTASFSLRMPPWMDSETFKKTVDKCLTTNVPYNAKAEVIWVSCNKGFTAPALPKNQMENLEKAAKEAFGGNHIMSNHMGGSIPFMGKLTHHFPNSKFFVTGILGPESNAHCGDEMAELGMLRNVLYVLTRFMEMSVSSSWKE